MAGAVALLPDPESPAAARRRVTQAVRRQAEAARQAGLQAADARRAEADARAAALARAIVEQEALVFAALDPDMLAREPRRIVARIAADFLVPAGHVTGSSRDQAVVRARWAAIAAVKAAHPTYSLPRLGRLFGRHHTTILHALRTMAERGVPQPPRRPARRSEA